MSADAHAQTRLSRFSFFLGFSTLRDGVASQRHREKAENIIARTMLQKLHTLVRSLRCFFAVLMLLAEPELPTLPGAILGLAGRRESLLLLGQLRVSVGGCQGGETWKARKQASKQIIYGIEQQEY